MENDGSSAGKKRGPERPTRRIAAEDGASDASGENRSDDDRIRKGSPGTYGTLAGGAAGGMGGVGMGGGASSAQEPS
jgi:hypothetical protein